MWNTLDKFIEFHRKKYSIGGRIDKEHKSELYSNLWICERKRIIILPVNCTYLLTTFDKYT